MKQISELRRDLVTGDWVVVATGRARRPDDFARHRRVDARQSKITCPFERLLPSALLVYDRRGEVFRVSQKTKPHLEKSWGLQVVPNKFPAFGVGECAVQRTVGPYQWQDGVGFHEVVITRDHEQTIAQMRVEEVVILLRAYRERYIGLKDAGCVEYISIFHNNGRDAGASVYHPHSQIIAIPVIPPDVGRSLRGSAAYSKKYRRCVHCTMNAFELKQKKRVIFANKHFIVFCPFVSRQAFEIRIFPRRHQPQFENIVDDELVSLGEALHIALAKLSWALNKPAYNFFIHTSPTAENSPYYHWHIEIVPKTAIWAGFEIGTGIEISTIAPESAARYLRSK